MFEKVGRRLGGDSAEDGRFGLLCSHECARAVETRFGIIDTVGAVRWAHSWTRNEHYLAGKSSFFPAGGYREHFGIVIAFEFRRVAHAAWFERAGPEERTVKWRLDKGGRTKSETCRNCGRTLVC